MKFFSRHSFCPSSSKGPFVGTTPLSPVLKSNKWNDCACKTELSFYASNCFLYYHILSFYCSQCAIYNFFIITSIAFVATRLNWLVAFIAGLLVYDKQAQGWEQVQEFDEEQVLSVAQGRYVELRFTMRSKLPLLCLWDFTFEMRDGSNQSANFLGKFCGDYGIGVVRSSGRYMWLQFIWKELYDFAAFYTGRSNNETGMEFLSISINIHPIWKM